MVDSRRLTAEDATFETFVFETWEMFYVLVFTTLDTAFHPYHSLEFNPDHTYGTLFPVRHQASNIQEGIYPHHQPI